jgi:hypothetical protein
MAYYIWPLDIVLVRLDHAMYLIKYNPAKEWLV